MLLCTVRSGTRLLPALEFESQIVYFRQIRTSIGITLSSSLEGFISDPRQILAVRKHYNELNAIAKKSGTPAEDVRFAPPISLPPKIWCIGLNFKEHASDLEAQMPGEPASFMRPVNTMIGHGASIRKPSGIGRVTAEAELGVVMGKESADLTLENAMEAVLGFVPVIDCTALDILEKNPRFLTRAKSYSTFFSTGPAIFVPDEIEPLDDVVISTMLNHQAARTNKVANMLFDPASLISFHSRVFTFQPGDILSTGTPGAVIINPGDVVGCEIDGLPVPTLENTVVEDEASYH